MAETAVSQVEEIFRLVWKKQKRNAKEIAAYVNDSSNVTTDLLDVLHPENSPVELSNLLRPVEIVYKGCTNDLQIEKAFTIEGRPGFIFIPNPFKSPQVQAQWINRFAVEYPVNGLSERNCLKSGQCNPLEDGIRWATLGFHYDWQNRKYTEGHQSPFPIALEQLAQDICKSMGLSIVSETAIINYYRRKSTLGGHKDDAEWTDEAPVVAISFGPAGVYVLGGDSHADPGPPAPVPLLVRNGDVVLLGGPSRMNVHGVPCMLPGTFPVEVEEQLSYPVAAFMKQTRINVNIRQVRPLIMSLLKRKF